MKSETPSKRFSTPGRNKKSIVNQSTPEPVSNIEDYHSIVISLKRHGNSWSAEKTTRRSVSFRPENSCSEFFCPKEPLDSPSPQRKKRKSESTPQRRSTRSMGPVERYQAGSGWETSTPTRGRGRPRKSSVSTTAVEDIATPTSGRGRLRKRAASSLMEDITTDDDHESSRNDSDDNYEPTARRSKAAVPASTRSETPRTPRTSRLVSEYS